MNTPFVQISVLVATALLGATIITGLIRWRDQSCICVLGRALGGALLGILLRMLIG